jgi:hypothetical protein
MARTRKQLEATAYHEARHAIAAWAQLSLFDSDWHICTGEIVKYPP